MEVDGEHLELFGKLVRHEQVFLARSFQSLAYADTPTFLLTASHNLEAD